MRVRIPARFGLRNCGHGGSKLGIPSRLYPYGFKLLEAINPGWKSFACHFYQESPPSSDDGCAIMYSYPATKMAEMRIDAYRAIFVLERIATAAPVAITMDDAAISPHRIRFTFPSFDACSWKKGEETVNHDGQNPAKTPDASPTRRMMIVISSLLHVIRLTTSYP